MRQLPGLAEVKIEGKKLLKLFSQEAGGHRWQRVPPTEKRGRVQTSTITVAVLPIVSPQSVHLSERDLSWKACRGSGPGGQHRNKTDSAVQLTHKPTGIVVRCESERSQPTNLRLAKEVLAARLQQQSDEKTMNTQNKKRRSQVGKGMRSDKRRTVRVQAGKVIDHLSGKKMKVAKYLRGDIESLWHTTP